MAHSIQQFGGRTEIINDLDLAALFIVARQICEGRQTSVPPFIAWEHSLRHYGLGAIDLALDRLTEIEAENFGTTLQSVLVGLHAFGSHIPASLLQQRNMSLGVVFSDYPVALLVDVVAQLSSFISAGKGNENRA